jgi:hypothetical protein
MAQQGQGLPGTGDCSQIDHDVLTSEEGTDLFNSYQLNSTRRLELLRQQAHNSSANITIGTMYGQRPFCFCEFQHIAASGELGG